MQDITKTLCGYELSSTQVSKVTKELDVEFNEFRNRPIEAVCYLIVDAVYLKIRHQGSVTSLPVLLAYGVTPDGRRSILRVSSGLSEAEMHWWRFFEQLQARGIHGMQRMISDDHPGLKAAKRAVFPSLKWQRCQFHLAQNAQSYAPKKSMRAEIGESMREIFNSPTLDIALEMKLRAIEKYQKNAPQFAKWLEENVDEGLTVFEFLHEHRKKIRTSNGIERVNREIKRRTRVAVLFPNEDSALRLVTGVVIEIHEEWVTGRMYLDMCLLLERDSLRKD